MYGEAELPKVTGQVPRPLNILLAEDTVFFKKAITAVLVKAGHNVVHVGDGQEALEMFKLKGDRFDLIVSDIEMPRLNGFELAKAIRTGSVNSQVPLLAISARANASYIAQGKQAGFNIYLEKLKPDHLLKSVAELTNPEEKAG